MQAVLLRHTEIDKAAWDECLMRSGNALAYAHSSWLDAMCPDWEAIVYGNYEMIMPLPVRRKFGIRYLFAPAFTQQLGLFCENPVKQETLAECITIVKQHYRFAELLFNYANAIEGGSTRNNLVVDLNKSRNAIANGYKTDLIKNLKRAEKFQLQYKPSQNVDEALALYEKQYGAQMGIKANEFRLFKELMNAWQKKGMCFIRKVETEHGALLSCGVFAYFQKRIYNLASTTLPNGRMMEANHWLFFQLINEFAEQAEWLDFEGSDLPGIARFYEKFGASSQPYYVQTINNLPPILRWLKR